ncbi:MAG: hypothetical protein JST54_27545 [Deltaproteobacteria bacterium]|nr:hypothetical protein [Deltaproteobacteria bacterium]
MRSLPFILAGLALVLACEDPPPKHLGGQTTIQHDSAPAAPAMPTPAGDTAQLPPNHPKLGDGASTHDAADAAPQGDDAQVPHDDAKALLARVEAMKEQLKDKPKTIEVTVALGSLYYDNGKYLDAVDYYRQAIDQGAKLASDYQAISTAAQKAGVKPSELNAAGCDRNVIHDSDPMMERARTLKSQGKLADALACATEAVRPVVLAHERRGNAFFLIGNPSEAVHEHEKALQIEPDHAESLFFRGAILFDSRGDDVEALKQAQASWTRFLQVAPSSPRARAVKEMLPKLSEAIRLGGASKLPRAQPVAEAEQPQQAPPMQQGGGLRPAPLDPGAQEAIMNTEVTPDMIQGFNQVLDEATGQLAKNDIDGARTNIVRVFPFVMADQQKGTNKIPAPTRAKAQALMGLYMMGKGAPMGPMMMQQAANGDPKTVDALADALKAKGDAAHAKALWAAIQAAAPEYFNANKVADKLK